MFTEEFLLNIEDHAKLGEAMVLIAYKKASNQPILVVDTPAIFNELPTFIELPTIESPTVVIIEKRSWWKTIWFYLNMDIVELICLSKKWLNQKAK